MRLTSDVVLVGGGTLTGFGISADFDAHAYLLDGGDELALVDCGMGTPEGMERVLANVLATGLDPGRIGRLFLTHYHTDHAGGTARYRERLGIPVAISAAAAPALEAPDHAATGFRAAREAGFFPSDFSYDACPVSDRLEDGDQRPVGRLTLRFLATPGHCAGHGSYLGAADDGGCLRLEKEPRQAELRRLHDRRGRVIPIRKHLTPHLLDGVPVGEVGDVGRHAHDVGDLAAGRLDDGLYDPPDLACLGFRVAGADDPKLLVEGDLPGYEEQAADLDPVRVGPRKRVRAAVGSDDLLPRCLEAHGSTPLS